MNKSGKERLEQYLDRVRELYKGINSWIKEKTDLLNRTRFVGAQKKEADGWILRSCSESDDLVIISLWAIFERIIIQYVQEQTKVCFE